jgi:asparagine synthase (glutamine-hydrolysing)
MDYLSAYTFPERLPDVLQPAFLPERVPTLAPPGCEHDPGVQAFVDTTIQTVLPADYLRKVDVASSAHGLEVRPVLLANQVLECAAAVPVELKMAGGRTKVPLRQLLGRYLPPEITRAPKRGFTIPLDDWLGRNACRHLSAQLGASKRLKEVVRPTYIDEILRGLECGTWDRRRHSRYMLTQRFFLLWVLDRWLQRWSPA